MGEDFLKKATLKKKERGNSFSVAAKNHVDNNEGKQKDKACCH